MVVEFDYSHIAGVGDDTRTWGPPFVGEESAYFLSINRNKKSLTVNVKTPEGANIIKELAQQSDVFVENYLPGKLSAMGLGYTHLRDINPRLVYCSITGYGQDGPLKMRAGYDVIAAGMGGLMHITGPEDGEPCRVGVAMTDLSTGLYAYGAITTALLQRHQTGRGQHIDCNLLSTQVATLTHIGSNYLNAGCEARRYGSGHGSIVPYQAFNTADSYIIVGCGTDHMFKSLCQRMDLTDLGEDARYRHNADRVRHRQTLLATLSDRFCQQSTDEWLTQFEGSAFTFGPINSIERVFADKQVINNDLIQTMEHVTEGRIRVPGPAVRYSGGGVVLPLPPPTLGQHTVQVLSELLDMDEPTINMLQANGII